MSNDKICFQDDFLAHQRFTQVIEKFKRRAKKLLQQHALDGNTWRSYSCNIFWNWNLTAKRRSQSIHDKNGRMFLTMPS